MATYIKTLNEGSNIIFPRTSASAVLTSDDDNIQNKLDDLIPQIKTTMDSSITLNTQYYLGTQTAVTITMPTTASLGQDFIVCFKSGSTACTLTCDLTGFSYVLKVNTISWLKFILVNKGSTSADDEWLVETKEG